MAPRGRAQSLNLKDSGVDVRVALRAGSVNRARAAEDGIEAVTPEQGVADADLVMLLLPDEVQPEFHRQVLEPGLKPGAALVFAHGFNIHYGLIEPHADIDVLLVAPKGIGDQVRSTFVDGHGVPGLVAVHQDASGHALERALGYARAVGHGRAVILQTSFADETETDLFGEQAVLCGGLTALAEAGFDTLVEAGYPAELAYFECLHEIKLIADLMYARGVAGMRDSISTTAAFGDATRGRRLVGPDVRAEMRAILDEIRSGAFAAELMTEVADGLPKTRAEQARTRAHALEAVGRELRGKMSLPGGGKQGESE
jgi:ketol-acid reductoisomerase